MRDSLRFAHRVVMQLPAVDANHISIASWADLSRSSMKSAVRDYQKLLDVDVKDPEMLTKLPSRLLEYQYRLGWDEEDYVAPAKLLKFSPGTSCYISHDSPFVAARRARLRFDRSSLNASLFKRRCSPTDKCPVCGLVEDTDHVLLHCPAYDAARQACKAAFAFHKVDFNAGILLGQVEDLPAHLQKPILEASGTLLSQIKRIGPL
jgi:hypothetical protein